MPRPQKARECSGVQPDRLVVVEHGAVGHSQRLEHVAAAGECVGVGRVDRDGFVVDLERGFIVCPAGDRPGPGPGRRPRGPTVGIRRSCGRFQSWIAVLKLSSASSFRSSMSRAIPRFPQLSAKAASGTGSGQPRRVEVVDRPRPRRRVTPRCCAGSRGRSRRAPSRACRAPGSMRPA